jgi:hypothetical protein
MKQALLLTLLFPYQLYSAVGCMDNSKHTNRSEGYDYKTYHYVACACRCERYEQLFDRGACAHCGHFRVPEPVAWLPSL